MKENIDDKFFAGYGKIVKKTVGIPGFQMNMPLVQNSYPGSTGLEIELEGSRPFPIEGDIQKHRGATSGSTWFTHNDGSLRGHSIEYVMSSPCCIDELEPMLKGLFEVIAAHKVKINNSNRCSTHVHVNMNGFKVNQITSIIALWNVFEETLINWCGEVRKNNHFCLSSKEALSTVKAWDTFLRTGVRPGDANLKYSALNILPLWRIGSLEFRCGPPVDEPVIPTTWASFIHHFVQYAAERYTDPTTLASALSELGGEEIFRSICARANLHDFAKQVITGDKNFEHSCMTGFRNAQNIVMGYPWYDWLPLINKEYIPDPFAEGKGRKKPRWGAEAINFEVMNDEIRINRGEDRFAQVGQELLNRIGPEARNERPVTRREPRIILSSMTADIQEAARPSVPGDIYVILAVDDGQRIISQQQYVAGHGWIDIAAWRINQHGEINWDLLDEVPEFIRENMNG